MALIKNISTGDPTFDAAFTNITQSSSFNTDAGSLYILCFTRSIEGTPTLTNCDIIVPFQTVASGTRAGESFYTSICVVRSLSTSITIPNASINQPHTIVYSKIGS